jgi:hypothetical protein
MDGPACHGTHEFSLIEIEQHDRLFDTANGKRLVVTVQYQYFAAKRRMGGIKVVVVEIVTGKT